MHLIASRLFAYTGRPMNGYGHMDIIGAAASTANRIFSETWEIDEPGSLGGFGLGRGLHRRSRSYNNLAYSNAMGAVSPVAASASPGYAYGGGYDTYGGGYGGYANYSPYAGAGAGAGALLTPGHAGGTAAYPQVGAYTTGGVPMAYGMDDMYRPGRGYPGRRHHHRRHRSISPSLRYGSYY